MDTETLLALVAILALLVALRLLRLVARLAAALERALRVRPRRSKMVRPKRTGCQLD